jgi:nucleoid-associated protein YgaU
MTSKSAGKSSGGSGYEIYVVRRGDSLSQISKKIDFSLYRTHKKEIKKLK